jgi:eukaryotic-like serine/threonine-protein kinase
LRTQTKIIKRFTTLSLFVLAAMLLTACGAVPANNYAGMSTDGQKLYVSNQSFVFAVDAGTGSVEWKYPAKAEQNTTFFGAPAVADGWIFAGSYNNVAYGFALQGIDPTSPTPTWSYRDYEGKGRFIGAPVVAGDVVILPSTDKHIYALDKKSGTLRWKFATRGALWAPAASDSTLAYQPGLDHYLYAIDLASGKQAWEIDLGGPIVGGVTLDAQGYLYVGTLNHTLYAVDTETGKALWNATVEGNIWAAPLLHEGKLYFGTDKNKVYIFDAAAGKATQTLETSSSVIGSPVLTDGTITIGTEGGEIFTLTLDGENRPWTRTLKGKLYSNPVVINNQVVFAVFQGDHILAGYDFQGTLDEKWNAVAPK